MTAVLGLDIGGANLKAAHTVGVARSMAYALWRRPEGLADALRALIASLPPADRLAVTMTGELCDCWESKRHGVAAILDAVRASADALPLYVWTNQGCFVDPATAHTQALAVASANWLALATLAARLASHGPALLLDIGTTTTDLVPLLDGRPVPRGRTDPERLHCGELYYAGWKRTPVCALPQTGVVGEFFATMHDVYLVLGTVPEHADDRDTADGQPATRVAAARRLARMVLADLETSSAQQRAELARQWSDTHLGGIARAIDRVVGAMSTPPRTLITSGSGEFLIPALQRMDRFPAVLRRCPRVSLHEHLGPERSAAACAHAVATLLAEQEG